MADTRTYVGPRYTGWDIARPTVIGGILGAILGGVLVVVVIMGHNLAHWGIPGAIYVGSVPYRVAAVGGLVLGLGTGMVRTGVRLLRTGIRYRTTRAGRTNT